MIVQGRNADALLNDPTLRRSIESMKATVQQIQWEHSVSGKFTERDRARLDAMAWACSCFEQCLTTMMREGALTEDQLLREGKERPSWGSLREVRYGG